MKRRSIGHWLGASLLAISAPTIAQTDRPLRVAWVSVDQAGAKSPVFAAFRAGMAALGYLEGKNLMLDTWWGDGSAQRLVAQRDEMLRSQPDVIVAQGGVALGPMLDASVTRPLVFSMSGDPVLAKIVAAYGQPGGNRTGITLFAAELTGKRMALLKEIVPALRSIAVVGNPTHPGAPREIEAARVAAAKLGLTQTYFPSQTQAELDGILADIARRRFDAILVMSDGFALNQAQRIAEFSLRERIPVVAGWATFAQRGNLMAYGPEFEDVHRRLASYVDRIRKGAKPGDLPIEQPTKFELVINMKTAKALGITVSQALLLQADQVIP
jgi:putative ABC transport system substrate-binding protein